MVLTLGGLLFLSRCSTGPGPTSDPCLERGGFAEHLGKADANCAERYGDPFVVPGFGKGSSVWLVCCRLNPCIAASPTFNQCRATPCLDDQLALSLACNSPAEACCGLTDAMAPDTVIPEASTDGGIDGDARFD